MVECVKKLINCIKKEAQEKSMYSLEGLKNDFQADFAATIKDRVDAAVTTLLTQDKESIRATLDAALFSAESAQLINDLTEKLLIGNLVGNRALIGAVVIESSKNGHPLHKIRDALVSALAGNRNESRNAVSQLIQFAIGPAASMETRKEFYIALQTEAVAKSGTNLMDIARHLQQISKTPEVFVERKIGNIISASVGARDEAAYAVAVAAYSPNSIPAVGLVYSFPANSLPLQALLAIARKSNTKIAIEIENTMTNVINGRFSAGSAVPIKDGRGSNKGSLPASAQLSKLLQEIDGLEKMTSNTRKNLGGTGKGKAAANARSAAEAAAHFARMKAGAEAGKASGKF